MMIVRLQDGTGIKYNDANYVIYNKHAWELYSKKGGRWIASIVPVANVILEVEPACAVTPAPIASLKTALAFVLEHCEKTGSSWSDEACYMAELKAKLREFNATTKSWS